jgi:hypothetical protein
MSSSISKRWFAVVVAVLALVSYLGMRDTVRVDGKLPRKDAKAIISGVEERNTLFRHIEVKPEPDGTVLACVREPGDRWSVTVFTNQAGVWKKCAWYLLESDKSIVRN